MDKKGLVNIISEMLIPIGFKKKGNFWIKIGDDITKMVNLQKSNYGNYFYINYGYILNCIPLDNEMMHIYNRVTSLDVEERSRIHFLLDLDSQISDEERRKELSKILYDKLIVKVKGINTEAELLNELKRRPNLNDIPLTVKNYFNLEK